MVKAVFGVSGKVFLHILNKSYCFGFKSTTLNVTLQVPLMHLIFCNKVLELSA